jgi:serine/threonine protein kinase
MVLIAASIARPDADDRVIHANMDTMRICKQCRQPLPENAPGALCPQCVAKVASDREPPAPESKIAPVVAELAPYFPQLEILEFLGKGGMGMVYKARQPQLDRLVALKILPSESQQHAAFAERFNREAKALAKLNHPGIVNGYDFGQTGPYYYFLMEYVNGMNLRQLLDNETVTPRQTLDLVVQICTALQYAHDEGVVHRDIKPANILVNKKGQVKIADFGLAKLLDNAPDSALTTSQAAMGTLNYMAPEQRENARDVDHRADIYSLGVVFYELLTGEVPMGRFEPPSKKAPVDVRLDEVVLRALEREPARRYQHASEIKSGVEAITHISAAGIGRMERWAVRAGALLLCAAALLASAIWLKPYAPALLDLLIKPDPTRLVARAKERLERYDRPGNIDKAILELQRAARQDPSFTEARAWLGLAYWRRYKQKKEVQDRSEASRCAAEALRLNTNSPPALFVQGLVANEEKRYSDATNFLCRANDTEKWENGEVLIQIATVYRNMTNMSNSFLYAQKANEVQRKPWYFYNSLGSYEFSLGHLEAAQSNFQAATLVAKDSPTAWLNLGQVLLYKDNRNEDEDALKYLKESLALDPSDGAYDGLGEHYFNISNWQAAASNFQDAAKLNPARYDYPGNAGLALIRLPGASYQAMAEEQLRKAVDKVRSRLKETEDHVAEANLGLYQAVLGQTADAYATLRHAMESAPNVPQVSDNIEAAAEYLEDVCHRSGEAERFRQLLPKKDVHP